jgi:hypothetical protein
MAQGAFDYYISNTGNDGSLGNSASTPRQTISGVTAALSTAGLGASPVKIGFRGGDVFNETFNPAYPVVAGSYFENGASRDFAILNGTSVFDDGWIRTPGTSNTFEQAIPLMGFTGYGINSVGFYSMVYVIEVDRELERTAPITARKLLKFVPALEAADATPGSFYEPVTLGVNPKTIYIHTSNGSSPNNNPRYRYEVTVRDRAINSSFQKNNRYERLWIRGYGAGNGMISAGADSYFNRMIFGPGAGIHHLGLRGAVVDHSLFLPAADNTNVYAVVFYDVEGFGRHNSMKNTIFLDVPYPLYSHTSNGTNFGALELDNVIAFADTARAESFAELNNTDTMLVNNVYVSGYRSGCSNVNAKYVVAKNNIFTEVVNGISVWASNETVTINNCFIKTRGVGNNTGVGISLNSRLLLANSIVHIRNYKNSPDISSVGSFVRGAGINSNYANISGNIFVCDTDPSKYVTAGSYFEGTNNAGVAASRWRNNVYVLLRGNKIVWTINNSSNLAGRSETVSFETWKARTGQDGNSLFFDLRNDPRGLKAIFVDPDNGDYSLANTFEGNKIRELRAGMTSPVSCFLKKPTYEEAAKMIMNEGVLTANACRSTCLQNNIRIRHQFTESLLPGKKIQLQWSVEDERNVDHYEMVRSFGNADFKNIAYLPATGEALYDFTDTDVMPGITYRYSLVVVTHLQEKCYSAVRTVKTEEGKPITLYPNPSSGHISLSLNAYTGPVAVTITDVSGRIVYTKEHTSTYGIPLQLNLSSRSRGIYWIRVKTDQQQTLQSFVLQ